MLETGISNLWHCGHCMRALGSSFFTRPEQAASQRKWRLGQGSWSGPAKNQEPSDGVDPQNYGFSFGFHVAPPQSGHRASKKTRPCQDWAGSTSAATCRPLCPADGCPRLIRQQSTSNCMQHRLVPGMDAPLGTAHLVVAGAGGQLAAWPGLDPFHALNGSHLMIGGWQETSCCRPEDLRTSNLFGPLTYLHRLVGRQFKPVAFLRCTSFFSRRFLCF